MAGAAGIAGATSACATGPDAKAAANIPARLTKNYQTAQDWVTAFFEKGAEEVLGYYADDFV